MESHYETRLGLQQGTSGRTISRQEETSPDPLHTGHFVPSQHIPLPIQFGHFRVLLTFCINSGMQNFIQ